MWSQGRADPEPPPAPPAAGRGVQTAPGKDPQTPGRQPEGGTAGGDLTLQPPAATPDFRAIFESVPGLYLVLLPDAPRYTIIAASEGYLQATMTRREDILGRGLFEVFPDNPNEPGATGVRNLRTSLERVVEQRAPHTMALQRYDIRRPSREGGGFVERWWSPMNAPVSGPGGELTCIVHRVAEVTEFVQLKQRGMEHQRLAEDMRVRAETAEAEIFLRAQEVQEANRRLEAVNRQLQGANEELEAFSYSVSHDLRAPLRHMDGFIGLLLRSAAPKLSDQERHYLQVIEGAARRAGMLVDDLLSFSRMGRAEMHHTELDMNRLVDEVRQSLADQASGREVHWSVGRLPRIYGDKSMLVQVWTNLLSNALKYTRPRARAEITVEGHVDAGPGEAVFWVRDNGVGFDMRFVDKLFGVFQRLHHQEDFEGTGIGLANVRRVIQRHGGRVWAHGVPERGATFSFTLPTRGPRPDVKP